MQGRCQENAARNMNSTVAFQEKGFATETTLKATCAPMLNFYVGAIIFCKFLVVFFVKVVLEFFW